MRILIIGSSQTKHIVEIYKDCGWGVNTFIKHKGNLFLKAKNLFSLLFADVVYFVGGVDYKKNRDLRIAKAFGKKIIVHWIGTDVLIQTESFRRNGEKINSDVVNLAVTPQLKEELKEAEIESMYVPIVPADIPYPSAPEMPKSHAALVYLPEGREDFYGWSKVKLLAIKNPTIPFYVVANDGVCEDNLPCNIVFMGTLSHEQLLELYKKISILLRVPVHDGLPVMMLEAQGMGRKVIHPYAFPFAAAPEDKSDASLLKTFEKIVSSPPALDVDAKRYVDEMFSHKNMVELYKRNGLA